MRVNTTKEIQSNAFSTIPLEVLESGQAQNYLDHVYTCINSTCDRIDENAS